MSTTGDFNFELSYALRRLSDLIESRVLWQESGLVYRQSVYIEVLILLRDICAKLNLLNYRISFTDDVKIRPSEKINDVTDVITKFRDSVCHLDTHKKYYDNKGFSFIELRGKQVYQLEPRLSSKYEDDIAFIMGEDVLYLKRHIERVFDEIKIILRSYLGTTLFNFALRIRSSS